MEDINEMRLIRREKLQNLIESGKNPYVHEKFEGRIQSQEIKDGYSEYEGKTVRIAGRIMSKRGHGKVNFMDIQDMSGRIQTFNKLDNFSEEEKIERVARDTLDMKKEGEIIYKVADEENK